MSSDSTLIESDIGNTIWTYLTETFPQYRITIAHSRTGETIITTAHPKKNQPVTLRIVGNTARLIHHNLTELNLADPDFIPQLTKLIGESFNG